MTNRERLEKTTIKAFRKRWSKILRDLDAGKPSLAKKRYRCFEADTDERQKRLAEEFYGLEHAKKMASLSDEEIIKNLSCYLSPAIRFALQEYEDEPEKQEQFMAGLAQSEYVLLDSKICHSILHDNDNWEGWGVSEYPAAVVYDDWYEGSFGGSFFVCGSFILSKSTGEPFSKRDTEWLKKAIVENIESYDGDETLWGYEFEPLDRRRMWIYLFVMDRDNYLGELEELIGKLSKKQLLFLVKKIIDQAAEDSTCNTLPDMKRFYKRFELRMKNHFRNIELQHREGIISTISNFIRHKNSENQVVKSIERTALNLIGEKDFMNYHGIDYFGV
jgi:hypothetical protein